jgi:hypothetical protein
MNDAIILAGFIVAIPIWIAAYQISKLRKQ